MTVVTQLPDLNHRRGCSPSAKLAGPDFSDRLMLGASESWAIDQSGAFFSSEVIAMVPVKILMTPVEKVKTIDRDGTVRQAAESMRMHGVSSLLVRKGDAVVGIVTDTDLARRVMAVGLNPDSTTVEQIMSAPVLQIDAEATLLDANDLMARKGLRHLGVQKDGKLVGLVSVRDLLNFLTKYPRS